jgi:hypothetical protein
MSILTDVCGWLHLWTTFVDKFYVQLAKVTVIGQLWTTFVDKFYVQLAKVTVIGHLWTTFVA